MSRSSLRGLGRLLRSKRRPGLTRGVEIRALLASGDFQQELRRQEAYADRTCTRFMLVRMGLYLGDQTPREHERAMEVLADVVRERTRLSDIPGWCVDGGPPTLGIILRRTGPEGALRVVRALTAAFEEQIRRRLSAGTAVPSVSCESYLYPPELLASGVESDAEQRQPVPDPGQAEHRRNERGSQAAK